MSIVALIPIRGGSKSIPKKNILECHNSILGGKIRICMMNERCALNIDLTSDLDHIEKLI